MGSREAPSERQNEKRVNPTPWDLLTKSVGRQLHLELLRLFDAYATDGVVCPA